MNLLEHWIEDVYRVDDVTNVYEENGWDTAGERMLYVEMDVDCYGRKENVKKVFRASEWEMAKKNGYYMA